jgi:hypothetical protein
VRFEHPGLPHQRLESGPINAGHVADTHGARGPSSCRVAGMLAGA